MDFASQSIWSTGCFDEVFGATCTFSDFTSVSPPWISAEEHDAYARFVRALKHPSGRHSIEHRMHDAAGRERWVQTTCDGSYDVHGELRSLIGLTRDITEPRTFAQRLLDYTREAEARLASKNESVEMAIRSIGSGVAATGANDATDAPSASDDVLGLGEMFDRFIRLMSEINRRDLVLERAVSALSAAREVAETANLAKTQFLLNMSHELRTPLNAIMGYSEILLEEAGEAQHADDLRRIEAAAKHLLKLMDDILDFSKMETGAFSLTTEVGPIADLVEKVAQAVRPAASARGNTLTVEIAPDIGVAETDLGRLGQSLLNLLSNAAKFTENGHIQLSAHRQLQGGIDWLLFKVADSGAGIPVEKLQRLFEPFDQADNSVTRRQGGIGLGLALARRLSLMLGGELTATSKVDEGTTFSLRVPAHLSASHPDARARASGFR